MKSDLGPKLIGNTGYELRIVFLIFNYLGKNNCGTRKGAIRTPLEGRSVTVKTRVRVRVTSFLFFLLRYRAVRARWPLRSAAAAARYMIL